MKLASVLACVLGLAVIVGAEQPRLFLFSVDGMRTDYLHLARQLNLPNFISLIEGGVLAKGAYGVFPAVTFPSHTSMVTGVYPARHGIWNNNAFGPTDSNGNNNYFYEDIKVKTIFDAADEAGLSIMGVDWPVTVGAPIDPLFPGNDDNPGTLDEAKWLYNSIRGPVARVLPNATALFEYLADDKRTALALEFLDYKQPQFMAFHFNDLDDAQHHHGYMSPEAIAMLQKIDGYLGTILNKLTRLGLMKNATVMVVSDHGFLNTTGIEVSPGALLRTLGVIGPTATLPWQAWTDCSSGVCPIFIHPQAPDSVRQTIDEAVQLLQSNPEYGINRVYSPAEMVKLGCWPGAHVMLQIDTKFQFGGFHKMEGDVVQCCGLKGQHGYNPNLPEMFASFLINGPRVKVNQSIDMVRLIDVGPTIAYLMGLNLPGVDGRVVTEALRA